jgi:hypothetical protein
MPPTRVVSALRNKTREGLLVDVLDPNREVDPRYVSYVGQQPATRPLPRAGEGRLLEAQGEALK